MENRKKDGQVAVEKIVVTAIVLGIAAGILFNYGASLKSTGLNAEQKTENVFNKSLDEGDDAASSGDVATDINAEREDENYLYANIRPAYVGDGTGTYMNDQYKFVSDLDHQYVDVWVQFKKLEDGTLATASCSDHDGDYPDLIVKPTSTMGKNLQGKIKFPTSINKRNISIIGARTFRNTGFNNLFELPGELKTIEEEAFEYMGIRQGKFSFPKKLEYIGKRAFTSAFNDMECKEGVSFPDSLAYIGQEAFINGRFKGNLKLPQNLSFLGDSAFAHGMFSGDLYMPDGLEEIPFSVFENASFNGKITLPAKLKKISQYAFLNSKFVGNLTIPPLTETIEEGAFFNSKFSGPLNLPDTLIAVGGGALGSDSKFTGEITLPNSLVSLGNRAFGAPVFEGEVVLPNKLESLGDSVFKKCTFSGSIVLPQSLLKVGDSVFFSSTFSGDLILPSKLESLGSYVFDKSKFDNKVVVPDSLTQMGKNSFETIDAGGL